MKKGRAKRRVTIAGLMGLVAVAALVLFVFERAERNKRETIARARGILRSVYPMFDHRATPAEVGPTSADGRFRLVHFDDPRLFGRFNVMIPVAGDSIPTPPGGFTTPSYPASPPAPGTAPLAPGARSGSLPRGTP